ncbi:OmpA family protein [Halomonas sp. 328]|uniref:OmpA family protein n=1 Tax=Halomonas sp. 328 TaxID=2776704 RepID=UPI0018A79E90|nr:OmpA family protein [Halomonas sp. 328]MBF8222416.1 OmpA family protein [Halomonas sp. 328]
MTRPLPLPLLGWLLWLGLVLAGVAHADYAHHTPRALVEASVDSPSNIERGIMRRYLADHHGETPEGIFARAWLARQEGRNDEAQRIYRQAYEADPSLTSAGINLAHGLNDEGRAEEALALFQEVLARAPEDQELVRTIYFHLLEGMEAPERAERFLAEQEARLGADAWVIQFVRGLHAQFHGHDRPAAGRYYLAAAEAGGSDETIRRYMNLALDHLGMDTNQVLRQVMAYAQRHDSAVTYRDLGDRLVRLGGRREALEFYQRSMQAHPNAEALKSAFDSILSYRTEETLAFVDHWAPRLPNNWQAQATHADSFDFARFDLSRAQALRQRSIELAPHGPARATAVSQAVYALHDIYQLEPARQLLSEYAESLPTEEGRNLMQALLIENGLRASDYAAATAASNRLPERDVPGVSDNWLADIRERLTRAIQLEAQRRGFYERHPFLGNWEERFGESLVLAVEFEVGSDRLRPSAHRLLAQAAQALQSPGGEEYVFLIEGHTDSTGSDAINLPLSERRAAAVADALSREHGIPRERLQSVGHGPYHPLATNDTDEGRQRNRRVEIRPYGNIGEPEVAVSGQLDASALTASADGRLLATGMGPIQLWDTRRGVKVRELFRGGRVRAFSPDSRYLAVGSGYTEVSGSTTHTLYIYDTKTGHAVAQLPDDSTISNLAWSPFGDALAYTSMSGYLRIYDLSERRVRVVTRVGPTNSTGLIEWLADGERLVTDQVTGGGMRVWRAADLSVQRELPGADWPHAMRASRDGRWLVVADNNRRATIYDTRNWESRSLALPLVPKRMEPHPTRPWMVMNDFTRGSAGVAMLDMEQARILATADENQVEVGIGFTPDGEQVVIGSGDRIRWRDSATLAEVNALEGLAVESSGLRLDRVNDYAITEDADGAYVFSLSSGRRVHRMVTDTEQGWSQPDAEGTRLVTVDRDNHLVVFDSDTFEERRIKRLDFQVTRSVLASRDALVVAGVPHGQGDREDAVGIVVILDGEDYSERGRLRLPLVTAPIRYGRVIDPNLGHMAMDSDAGLLAINTAWQDGFGRPRVSSEQVDIYRLADAAEVSRVAVGRDLFGLRLDAGTLVASYRGRDSRRYDPQTAAHLSSEPGRSTFRIALEEGRELTWARDHLALGERRVSLPDSLRHVRVHEARNLVVAQTQANELLFFDLATLTHHLTIVVKRNDQWIAYTPEGHFAASQRGTEGVYWSLGDNYLPFEALRSRLERGHLVQQRLQALMEGRRAPEPSPQEEAAIDPALFETPYEVRLVSASGIETDEEVYRLRLEVTKASDELPDPEFRYVLNGRPIVQSRGFEEEAVWDGEEILGVERAFSLQPGYNRIEAVLRFRDAELERQVVEVTRRERQSPAQLSANTQLWFFGVGVSDYEIATQNLEFAHRDAEALAAMLESQEDGLFDRVNTRVLTNAEATERNVRIELNDFLRQASAEDLIVIFLAGHGVQDNEQNLYLMTHDADMQRPYTGMSIDRFRDFLQSRPINQKAVLMMDICHAGSMGPRRRGRITAEDAVQQLSDGTGTVVFASSTGAQSSLEDASFGGGHGAFTAALLEALSGQADREAGNGDGFNSIHEIISYTSRRVPQITQGAQHPTVPMLENVRDFPISVVEP